MRKDEVASRFSDKLSRKRPTRSWVTWLYKGKLYKELSPVQLGLLTKGDLIFALLHLSPGKADQQGLEWCSQPYALPFDNDAPICAARMLRDLDLNFPVNVKWSRCSALTRVNLLLIACLIQLFMLS